MKLKALPLFFVLFAGLLKAQTEQLNIVPAADLHISKFMKEWNIDGASVAIAKDGKLIYNKGFGYSDLAHTTQTPADGLFRIASVSKPITAIAIMKLVEEQKLSLNDKVFGKTAILNQDYYLDAITDQRLYSVTIQQLLEHTAGWDRNAPMDGYSHSDPAFFPLHVTKSLNEPNPVGDSTLIKFLLEKGLNHDPGKKYSYSNVGYLVLGKVIEKLGGMSYEAYVKKNILDPLSIKDAHIGKNLLAEKHKKEVEYNNRVTTRSMYGDGKRVPWQYGGFNLEAMNAHGGWIASAEALTTLFSGLPQILEPSSIEMMMRPGKVNPHYAKGWSVNNNNSWHTGSIDGTASFVCKTKDGYTWAFLLNSRSDNSAAFWEAFDRLPWNCLKELKSSPVAAKLPADPL
jgi:CubicO group peptidase (beta-lactamase class C family)